MDDKMSEIALSDLDIEALETRLEMASASPHIAGVDATIGVGHTWSF
jgi:hypothetical protein